VQGVYNPCLGRINLILRPRCPVHVYWGHDSIIEGWSLRSYKGALDNCKAIGLANPVRGIEQHQRLQLAISAFRLFRLVQ